MDGGDADARAETLKRRLAQLAPNESDVVDDPDDGEWEELGYASMEAYEDVTGAQLPPLESSPPAEPAGEWWDEDEVERVVPRLAAKFA